MSWLKSNKTKLPTADSALPGRQQSMPVAAAHFVLGTPMAEPFPQGAEKIIVGMGCFWGAEKKFWERDGVLTTAVGYSAGFTSNPSYEEVCSGRTGHNEVVLAVFNPQAVSLAEILAIFWENHDPTQGMRQGNDVGTQYRSGIYTFSDAQQQLAEMSRDAYQEVLTAAGYPQITTEIVAAGPFYYAEDYHQQYLAKNPWGYCGIGGTGLELPAGACQVGLPVEQLPQPEPASEKSQALS